MKDPVDELKRLERGGAEAAFPEGHVVVLVPVRCESGSSKVVLSRTVEVMTVVVRQLVGGNWPALDGWRRLLPSWFVEKCAEEQDAEQAERWLAWWRSLPPAEQASAVANAPWTLANWLHWFEPGPNQRQWIWWKGEVESEDLLSVVLIAESWPIAHGAFNWIVRAAGAIPLEETLWS